MTIAPWIWGLGVVAIGGAGIAVYEVTRPKATTAGGLVTASRGIVPGAAPPLVAVNRPSTPGTQTFAQTQPLGGPSVTIAPGMMASVQVPQNEALTLVLPAGGKWTQIKFVNASTTPETVLGQVNLAGDLTSPVALTAGQLSGSNAIAIEWIDRNAAAQMTGIPFTIQKVVTIRV